MNYRLIEAKPIDMKIVLAKKRAKFVLHRLYQSAIFVLAVPRSQQELLSLPDTVREIISPFTAGGKEHRHNHCPRENSPK